MATTPIGFLLVLVSMFIILICHSCIQHLRYPATLSDLQDLFDGIHEMKSQQPHDRPPGQASAPGYHGDMKRMCSCVIVDDFDKYFVSMIQVS